MHSDRLGLDRRRLAWLGDVGDDGSWFEQLRMGKGNRAHVVAHDHHAHAKLGSLEQALGKARRQPDTAMRGRMARQLTGVQRNPRPGDPLHEGHRGIIVEIGVVLAVFLKNAVDAGRRLVSGLPGRDGCAQDLAFRVVDGDVLLAQGDDRHYRRAAEGAGGLFGVPALAAFGLCRCAEGQYHDRQQRHSRGSDTYSFNVLFHLALPIELEKTLTHPARQFASKLNLKSLERRRVSAYSWLASHACLGYSLLGRGPLRMYPARTEP